MPLHRLFVPPNLYTADDKAAIAKAITKVYSMLPEFYVVVIFVNVERDDYFVGGEKTDKFLRITVQHLARQFSGDASRKGFMDRYEAALQPWTSGRGIDWEIHIEESDRALWNVNGLTPPPPNSEAEKLWKTGNKAVPYL